MIGYAGKLFLCHAKTIPSGYEPLIEWTGGGSPVSGHGAEFSTMYLSKGSYTVHAGPAPRPGGWESPSGAGTRNTVKFKIYEVSSISRESSRGQIVWYGYPITFRATTDPPGYEGDVPWRVETHDHAWGTAADPETGVGPIFTTTFRSLDGTDRLWAQVYAGAAAALDEQDEPPDPRLGMTLYLESVAPFVKISRAAPQTLRVPRADVTLFAQTNIPVDHFIWAGAEEISHDRTSSTARAVLADVGPDQQVQAGEPDARPYTVKVTPVPRFQPLEEKSRSVTFLVTHNDPRDVSVIITDPTEAPMIGHAGRTFLCDARTSPPGYEDLIEWTGGGHPSSGTGPQFSTAYLSKGNYTLKAGPETDPAETGSDGPSGSQIEFRIYDIASIARQSPFGQTVSYGFPITFTATTDPSGFEQYIPWRVDTMDHMWGTAADPEEGTGPSFTTTFFRLYDTTLFWAQVYAGEEKALAQSDPPICGNGIVEPGEQCDDHNNVPCDGCSPTCKNESCGDGILCPNQGEQCDDGNTNDCDSCHNNCTANTGCGDLHVCAPEQCDDGNSNDCDPCHNDCTTNTGCGDLQRRSSATRLVRTAARGRARAVVCAPLG